MKQRREGCIQFKDNRPIVSVEEKGKCFQLNNKNEKATVSCITIDGCVFKREAIIRCDYLFEVDSLNKRKRIFYIELKGTDLIKGIKQIRNTVELTKHVFINSIYEARVVMGSVPLVSNRKEYLDLLDIVKRSGGTIKIKNQRIYQESL
ncbi:MAG: hypothetical protein NVSMB7_16440 [Chitinophagaceae bacterium]